MAKKTRNCSSKNHRTIRRNVRMLPYGASRGRYWCDACDTDRVPSWGKEMKKRARQNAKKEIKKYLKEN